MQFGVVKYTPYPDGPSPMSVKPGDKVLYDRRREAEVEIRGQMYSLVYETQSVLAILDSATVVQPGQFGEQTQSGNWIEHPAVQTGQGR